MEDLYCVRYTNKSVVIFGTNKGLQENNSLLTETLGGRRNRGLLAVDNTGKVVEAINGQQPFFEGYVFSLKAVDKIKKSLDLVPINSEPVK